MKNTATHVQLIQCQIEILRAMLLCQSPEEYQADWLPNGGKVMRDQFGRFAKKMGTIQEDVAAVVSGTGDLMNISVDAIGQLVKDLEFRKRTGLEVSSLLGQAIGHLVAQAQIFPGLEGQIDKFVAQQQKQLQEIYGKDNNAFAQALHKTNLPPPPKGAPLKDKMEFYAARYQAYEDALKNPEHRTTLDDVVKVIKASVPVAAGIGLAVAPEILIPMLLGVEVSIPALAASSLVSYGASEAASFGLGKVLDKTGLSETQKMGADIAVRMITVFSVVQFIPVESVIGFGIKKQVMEAGVPDEFGGRFDFVENAKGSKKPLLGQVAPYMLKVKMVERIVVKGINNMMKTGIPSDAEIASHIAKSAAKDADFAARKKAAEEVAKRIAERKNLQQQS